MKAILIKYFPIIFLLLILADIWQICDQETYRFITKPLLMLSLGCYYYSVASQPSRVLLIALFLSWLGDVFLLFSDTTYFILGLSSFLIMHIIYAVMFYRGSNQLTLSKAVFATLIIAPCLFLFYNLLDHVGDLLVAVIIYAFTIVAMLKTAIFRKTTEHNYTIILAGALCFFFSDLILAHNMFDPNLSDVLKGQLSILVMILYSGSQYLIVRGQLIEN